MKVFKFKNICHNMNVLFISGKKYTVIDVCAVFMMVIGLILFTLADNQVSPSFNTYG